MQPTQPLIDAIYADKVRRARMASLEQKLAAGPMLFEYACEAARAGIRAQHVHASPEEVEQLLRQRLAIASRLEEATWTPTE